MAAKQIASRLPSQWALLHRDEEGSVPLNQESRRRVDAIWQVRDPDGISSEIIVEVKRNLVEPRMVRELAAMLKETSNALRDQDGRTPAILIVSAYLSPATRERLAEVGIGYADSTGNIRFTTDRPAVYIEAQGADRNPDREERPLRSLKGGRAARVVRGLLDYRTPFGTRELAAETETSAAMISRVSSLLEPDEIVTKDGPRGRFVSVDWQSLARRWAADYDFTSSNTVTTWLEPRGTEALLNRLRDSKLRYAVTGSFAASRIAPIAEPRLAALYVDDPETAVESLGLRPAGAGGNVLLVVPFDPVALERVENDGGITYARVTQVLLDQMTGPGRAPQEADALVEWMRDNEDTWKLSLNKTT